MVKFLAVTETLKQLVENQEIFQEELAELRGGRAAPMNVDPEDADGGRKEEDSQWEGWPEEPPTWDDVLNCTALAPVSPDGVLLCSLLATPPVWINWELRT